MILDPIFNKYKTVFTILDTIDIVEPNTSRIILYLNLEFILKVILTCDVNNKLLATENENEVKTSLISNIINLAQHYRWYFSKKGYDCHIYIYWNYQRNKYKNDQYIKGYRDYYNNKLYNTASCKYITDNIASCYKTLRLIIRYLNQVDLIDSSDIESSVIPYVLHENLYKNETKINHIIISNDKYDFQYTRYGFKVLVPSQDKTKVLTDKNVIEYLKDINDVRNDVMIPANYVSFVISLMGCKYRNIMKIAGIGLSTILKMVRTGINELIIGDNSTDIDSLSGIICEDYRERFVKNYLCTDIEKQYQALSPLDIHKIVSQKEDKYDDNAIDYINERYFQFCPIFVVKNHKSQVFQEDLNRKSIFDRK